MKASLYHIQINVTNPKKSFPFYKDFFDYMEFELIDEGDGYLGFSNGTTDFWLIETEGRFKKSPFHRKKTGLNHLAFEVKRKNDVDKFVKEFLKPRKIKGLYNSPKKFPEHSDTYYAVYFEDPDRIKLEVVCK